MDVNTGYIQFHSSVFHFSIVQSESIYFCISVSLDATGISHAKKLFIKISRYQIKSFFSNNFFSKFSLNLNSISFGDTTFWNLFSTRIDMIREKFLSVISVQISSRCIGQYLASISSIIH